MLVETEILFDPVDDSAATCMDAKVLYAQLKVRHLQKE
jgi:hypothetical protein